MDGSPSRGTVPASGYGHAMPVTDLVSTGETIPIRLFLGGFDLTPTFREVNKKYSTRYYLSLVLIDEGPFSFFPPSQVFDRQFSFSITDFYKMHAATLNNQRLSFTDKHPKSPPHNCKKHSRNHSRSLERLDE